jgi:phospholipid/cholesterol/gamma-HCH transport system substrate-binding protein
METRANYALIGLFMLAVTAGAFVFVYWFSRAGEGGDRANYRIVFDGAVSGLRTGGAVLFNGIKVGEVSDLKLNPQNPRQVLATIAVDKSVPIRGDAKVGLDFQGLTGIASISIKGVSSDAPSLTVEIGQLPTLIADPAATRDVSATIREVAVNASALVRRLDEDISENRESLRSTLTNIESFSTALGRNAERLDRVMAGMESMTAGDVKNSLLETTRSMRTLSDNLDKRTAEISADARRTLAELGRAIHNFDRNPQRVLFGPGSADAPPQTTSPQATSPRVASPPRRRAPEAR